VERSHRRFAKGPEPFVGAGDDHPVAPFDPETRQQTGDRLVAAFDRDNRGTDAGVDARTREVCPARREASVRTRSPVL
jgi:ribosome modulation factor